MTNTPAAFPGGDEAREIQHAVDMLVDLIPDTHDAAYPDRVQRACRESFAMNARLLVDFLTHEPKTVKGQTIDIAPTDFAPGWTVEPVDKNNPSVIEQQWQWASQQVAHFSKSRTDDTSYNVDAEKLRFVADIILDEMERWVREVEAATHTDAAALRSSVDSAVARLASQT